MAARMREFDWSKTALGPTGRWPASPPALDAFAFAFQDGRVVKVPAGS